LRDEQEKYNELFQGTSFYVSHRKATIMFLIFLHSSAHTPFWQSQAELFTFIILIVTAVIIPLCAWGWRKWYVYPRTFALDFPLFPYGDKRDTDAAPSKTIGIERTSVQVRIQVRYAVVIEDFNLRFINSNGSDVPPSTIKITDICDQTQHGGYFCKSDDGHGGWNCGYYARTLHKGKKEYLRYQIEVEANREWDGLLSFMGYDKEGKRAFARQQFHVTG
jgi:hypothetical protein